MRIGRLKGPCRKLLAYKRLFGENAEVGTYKVQFDTSRAYVARTPVKIPYTVKIRQVSRRDPAAARGTGSTWIAWTRLE